MESAEALIKRLILACSGTIDAVDLDVAADFAARGESGAALEHLITSIIENDLRIGPPVAEALRGCYAALGEPDNNDLARVEACHLLKVDP